MTRVLSPMLTAGLLPNALLHAIQLRRLPSTTARELAMPRLPALRAAHLLIRRTKRRAKVTPTFAAPFDDSSSHAASLSLDTPHPIVSLPSYRRRPVRSQARSSWRAKPNEMSPSNCSLKVSLPRRFVLVVVPIASCIPRRCPDAYSHCRAVRPCELLAQSMHPRRAEPS